MLDLASRMLARNLEISHRLHDRYWAREWHGLAVAALIERMPNTPPHAASSDRRWWRSALRVR